MKKWILRIGGLVVLLAAVLAVFVVWGEMDTGVMSGRVKNEELPIIKPGWAGNPVDQKGRFMNDEFPFLPKLSGVLRWTLSGNPFEEAKKADTARLEVRDPAAFLDGDADGILWLGHASFFIRLNGVGILTDPIFGKPPFVTEYVSVPSPLDGLRNVDYVLLSHDHRDHCDETTLRAIAQKFPNAVFLGGLGMDDILGDWKTETNPVKTAGWFQEFLIESEPRAVATGFRLDGDKNPVATARGSDPEGNPPADAVGSDLRFFFVPVRHWARRGLFDLNQRLWGGYVIQSGETTIYFGGDSGYGRHYREVGELFPEIDYFLIAIGAYEPRWFMEPSHTSPGDALKAFQDIGAKTLVPMHYGRFDLSDEPPSEPLRALREEAGKLGLSEKIRVLTINESLEVK